MRECPRAATTMRLFAGMNRSGKFKALHVSMTRRWLWHRAVSIMRIGTKASKYGATACCRSLIIAAKNALVFQPVSLRTQNTFLGNNVSIWFTYLFKISLLLDTRIWGRCGWVSLWSHTKHAYVIAPRISFRLALIAAWLPMMFPFFSVGTWPRSWP